MRVLVIGGGDVGSAVAHQLFSRGHSVLICERAQSAHARRGMAFTDALFEPQAVLEGVEARLLSDLGSVAQCWRAAQFVPIVTLPENEVARRLRFDAVVDASMRRQHVRDDLRDMAAVAVGLGPGYRPGDNCDVAIETQWGDSLGRVLRDCAPSPRAGGPQPLNGVASGRFAVASVSGLWRTDASLGQVVCAGDELGRLSSEPVCAPIAGVLRGLTHDGVQVICGQRLLEIDPRAEPQVHGLGERPLAIALGVAQALSTWRATADRVP